MGKAKEIKALAPEECKELRRIIEAHIARFPAEKQDDVKKTFQPILKHIAAAENGTGCGEL